MQDKIARQVHQVLGYGLELKERLEHGERPHFDAEQTRLKGLLLGDGELRYVTDYAGEAAGSGAGSAAGNVRNTQGGLRGAEPFLGIRYALACWLDEIFIADSPWATEWTERMLEVALYGGSSQRAWRFWEQAKKAEARPGTDALEVYLWCVMLGFHGEPPPDVKPAPWIENVRKRILAERAVEFALPPEKEPPTSVPVLRGRERFGRMLRVAAALAIALAFAGTFFLVRGR